MNNESNRMKNSMWDTWDGVKFYPRPYDMDTQMGLSNTGQEIIRVDSEILIDMSPTHVEGTFAGFEYIDTTTDLRYMNYNTRTSKLWNAFAEEFKDEIKKAYVQLRSSGVYSYENIVKTIWADTDDVIGEIYFNKDAASKYLSQVTEKDSTYLQMLHGNRAQKYKKFLKERLVFLDTIFDYKESGSLNTEIGLRSDAAYGQGEGTTVRCYLGISSYSPQYVTVSIGSGADGKVTAYVGPESRYKDPDTGIEHEGTLFSFPIRGINKEMAITGAGNIKRINRLQALNLTEARIENATKILELDFSYSNRMNGLKVGNNIYLRNLNCTNSYLLGTATESQSLDLSNCKNLKTVDIAYTAFTGIVFPRDTVLNSINLTGSSVKNISIDGAEFLDDIRITGCDNINKFELNRCNRIETVDVAGSTIQNFIVTNCTKVKDVNLSECKSIAGFDVTNSYNIENLNMKGNTSPVMRDLKLYSMYNLKKLIVSQTTSAHTIRLPKYLNEIEATKAANGDGSALLWNTLEHLDLSNSSVMKIQYGSADVEGEVVDMSQLTNLSFLSFDSATSLTEIKDIQFTGNLQRLFYACKNLTKISGELTNANNSISNLFASCYSLADIDELNFNFVGVTNASYMFDRCFRAKTPMVKKLLDACGSTLTDVSGMCHMHSEDQLVGILGTSEDTTTEIPADLFSRNTNLQNAYHAFDITGYTSVHGDLFNPCADTINNLTYTFSRMPNLTTVGPNLLHNKPNLNTVAHLFASSAKLTHYIDEYPNIFIGSPNITSTFAMFSGCQTLASGEEGLGEMMYPLVNLTNCAYMFYDCYQNLTCEIPNGFLSKNTKLTKINGMFQRCRKIPTVPESLFRVNIGDTNKLPNLTKAVGVFAECNAMEGIVSSRFFLGAENLVNIGMVVEDNMPWSTARYPNEGFFQATSITGYHETFLNTVPKVQIVGGMFRNCKSLVDCHYYEGSNVLTRGNSVCEDLFINNKLIYDMGSFFEGCSKIEGHIPKGLFKNSAQLLQTVSFMFSGCAALSGVNIDVRNGEDPQTGISNEWFKDCGSLTSVAAFINGCETFTGTIPEDLFVDCVKLQQTQYFMQNCKMVSGGIPLLLFDSCRKTLNNTTAMFAGCESIDEELPTGDYETVQGITSYKLVTADTEGALRVVEFMNDPFTEVAYSDVVNLSPNLATIINASGNYYVTAEIGDVIKVKQLGLLAECLELTSIANMFNKCIKMPGGIPHDLLFTENQSRKYTKLTNISGLFKDCQGINKGYIEEETGITYICNPVLFDKCTALTDCSSVFNRMYKVPTNCQVHPKTFEKQAKVTTVYELFMGTPVTGAVSPLLFGNSINTLTDARKMFAFTNMTSVGATFLNGGGQNKKLRMVYGIFYRCSNLEGTSPEFWNGAKFTALQGDQNGFWGALHQCTKVTNYNAANAVSEDWVKQQQIYL